MCSPPTRTSSHVTQRSAGRHRRKVTFAEYAMTNRSMRRIFIATLAVVIMLPTPANARYTISCSSNNYRYQYCGANTDGYARLLNQQSRAACVHGRTWGFDNGGVWVNNGCSAQFEVGGSSRSGGG